MATNQFEVFGADMRDVGRLWLAAWRDALFGDDSPIDTQQGGQGQGFHTALLNASVKLISEGGDLILHKSLDRVKGVQLNWEGASQAAYSKASMEIRGSFLQEMMESLYQ